MTARTHSPGIFRPRWQRELWPVLSFAGALAFSGNPAPADTKTNSQAAAEVRRTLAAEPKGGNASRDEQLVKVIETAPDYSPARWAAGYVEQDGKWVKFDSLPESEAQNKTLAEYRQVRDDAPDTAGGHLKLANWCHQHGLKEQERSHLLRVLDFQPNRTDVRERLGVVRVGGVWMSPREARQAAARGKQAATDLKNWLPRVEKFRAALGGAPGRLRDLAAEQVRAIRNPSAIVALETTLAPSSDEAGMVVIDALVAMKRPEAAIALARLASFSESSETMDAAREKLKTLPTDHFVPAMLSSLVVPGAEQTTIVCDRYGRLLFQQAFVFEGADRKQVAVFDQIYNTYTVGAANDALVTASALGSAENAGRSLAADQQNRQIERTNARIIETLREVTGQTLSTDPRAWWQWWSDVNEIVSAGEKETEVTYVLEERSVRSVLPVYHSCLIAGTPIWTDHGPAAIETLRVGDRVLAKDSASGELAFKPVLRTTVRPRAPLVHISLPDETVVASGGHPFWVSGRAWVNARQLEPGMLIHTVTGTVPIEKVAIEENGQQPVYNLVVEDFHDYFAGKARLLLHDPTPREPAPGPVPGWQE